MLGVARQGGDRCEGTEQAHADHVEGDRRDQHPQAADAGGRDGEEKATGADEEAGHRAKQPVDAETGGERDTQLGAADVDGGVGAEGERVLGRGEVVLVDVGGG